MDTFLAMQTKSLLALSATVVIIAATTVMSIGVSMKAYSQNATAPTPPQQETANTTQIKNYLTQAIQALDSGNNTKALQQLDLAEDQLEEMTGTASIEDEEEEEGEEEEGEEEDDEGEQQD